MQTVWPHASIHKQIHHRKQRKSINGLDAKMRTTPNLTYEEFKGVYEDCKCPFCPHKMFSRNPYYVHKNPTKKNACPRVRELVPYLKGIKQGLLAGKSPKELRDKGYTRVVVVNPLEDDDHDGKRINHVLFV